MEMIEQIKDCEKKVNKYSHYQSRRTINDNPSERIMEMALAANDDIFIVLFPSFSDLPQV